MAVVVILSLLATSCATLRGSWQVAVDGMEQVVARVGTREHRFEGVYLRYFPSSLTLRPGDALRFILQGSGEPHTVTFGRLADDAVAAVEAHEDAQSVYEIEDLPEVRRLPKPIERTDDGVRLDRAAAERCFVRQDHPPDDEAYEDDCAPDDQPPFDGTQSLYNSGWLRADRNTFRMTLDPDIAPGTYRFLCLVHPATMHGRVEVVPEDADRPRPGVALEEGDDELDEAAGGLAAAALEAADATPEDWVAGVPPMGIPRGYVASFGAEAAEVPVGGTVTWNLFGLHSITFNPTGEARRGLVLERDGRLDPNEDAWEPNGGPDPPSDARLAQQADADDPLLLDGGRWDGEGTHNSGVIWAKTSGTVAYRLTFTRPGTFRYMCLVHSRMRGTVVVSEEASSTGGTG